jgi:alpha-galactosidase
MRKHARIRTSIVALGVGALVAGTASALAAPGAAAVTTAQGGSYNGLAPTPPMGFNDWNAFACNVSASLIEQTALAMHNNGMQADGYNYVNIDDCWMLGRNPSEIPPGQTKASVGRGADGHLIADPNYFPPSAPGLNDGIKVVADYVHSLGMKLGLYEEAGTATCQGLAGSYGHEATDAADFASWGVDYLKYDNCNAPAGTADTQQEYIDRYKRMSDALLATGRPIVYALCEWGNQNPWVWGPYQANLGRSTGDISPSFSSMLSNFTINAQHPPAAGAPLYFNDPDMLEIGTGTMTSLAAAVTAGTTTIPVSNVSRAIAGGAITVGTAAAGDLESDTVAAVGTAAGSTTLFTAASAGDTNVKVGNVGPFVVGQPITIDTGANVETPIVTAVGTPATVTTLSSSTAVGATNIKVASVTNLNVGDTLAIGTGANAETVTVTAVGTAGRTGTGVTVTPALTLAHATRTTVSDLNQPGTGVDFSPPLTMAHPTGTTASGLGTGITLATPLAKAHPSGELVGISGMTQTESQTEFSLWAEEAAPLIAGTDVVNMASQNLAIYENKNVIAIDQDPLGVQATVVSNANSQWTLNKPLANGDNAVVLFNASTATTARSVSLSDLGLDANRPYIVRDLWTHQTTAAQGTLGADVAAHGTAMYRVSADTFANLRAVVAEYSTNPDVTSGLNDKLTAAENSTNATARDNQINAFVHQVNAQTGKAFTADQASALTELANALK